MTNDLPTILPDRPSKPSWYRRMIPSRRTAIVSFIFLLVFVFGIRWTRIWMMPDVPVPFDVASFCEVPEIQEDAFEHFREALIHHQSMDGKRVLPWWDWVEKGRWEDVPDEVQHWVAKEHPVVELIRKAGRCKTGRLLPPEKYTLAYSDPVVLRSQEFFQLAQLEALRLLHEGRTDEVASLLHECQLACNHIGQHGSVFEQRCGIMCAGRLVPLWHHWGRRPDVTEDDIQAALDRLRESWQQRPVPSHALKIDYLAFITATEPPLTELSNAFDESLAENRFFGCWSLSPLLRGWESPFLWVLGEPERSARAARLKLTEYLPIADSLFVEQRPFLEGDPQFNQTQVRTAGLSTAEIRNCVKSTVYAQFDLQNRDLFGALARQAARSIILETELRLQLRIRQTQSRSPSDIEKWLAEFEWPVDPCSPDRQPIFHQATDDGLKMWSVSEDGIDNGGALTGPARQGDIGMTMPWPRLDGWLQALLEQEADDVQIAFLRRVGHPQRALVTSTDGSKLRRRDKSEIVPFVEFIRSTRRHDTHLGMSVRNAHLVIQAQGKSSRAG